MTTQEYVSLHDAFELVEVTKEQASAILQKLAELFTDSAPEVRQAFIEASEAILEETVEPTQP